MVEVKTKERILSSPNGSCPFEVAASAALATLLPLSRARNLIMCCPGANGSAHYCSTVCMADLPPSLYSIAVVALIWKRLISCCSPYLDYALFLSFLNKTSTPLEEKGGPIGAHRRGSCRCDLGVVAPASRMVDFG